MYETTSRQWVVRIDADLSKFAERFVWVKAKELLISSVLQ
jgi:hypothetical protein